MTISVIVPIYKVENYLCQCINSVLIQNYRDMEVILVDDGSPDACPQICDEFAANNSCILVIHKKNGGISKTRQVGVAKALSDYIMFLDADDWLSPNTLGHCSSILKHESDTDCLIFSYVREYSDRSIPAHILDGTCTLVGKKAESCIYRRLFGLVDDELRHPERLESMGSCWGRLYRRELVLQGSFFDTNEVGSSEDTLFNMYALYGCKKVIYLDEPLYHYRKTRLSITSAYRPQLIEQWERLFDYMEAVIKEKQLSTVYEEALDNRIALSVFGIGSNEMNAEKSFIFIMKRMKLYISSARYRKAISKINIKNMPLPWKAMLFFARNKLVFLLCLELDLIKRLRKSF